MKHEVLLEKFLHFEHENSLFDLEIHHLKFWQFIRTRIFSYILMEKGIFNKSEQEEFGFMPKLYYKALNFYISSLLKKTFFKFKKKDILFFCSSRRIQTDNNYQDQYLDPIIESCKMSYLALETYNKLGHLKPPRTQNLFYLDYIEFPSRFVNYFKKMKLNEIETGVIKTLQYNLNKTFNLKYSSLYSEINRFFLRYKYIYPRLKQLITRTNPKVIVEICSYEIFRQIANIIAKEKNIPTIEFQHGTMGRYHIAYNFIKKLYIKSFPDYIFVWGNYWKDNTHFPINDKNVIITGFPYFENQLSIRKDIKKEKAILFISQGTIGEKLAEVAFELADKMINYQVIFKLHPSEVSLANRYNLLKNKKNILVLQDPKILLYDLFAKCEYQVGVYSTALIEGLGFGLKTIMVKLQGWKYFEDLNSEFIELVDSTKEIVEFINKTQDKVLSSRIDHQWKKNSLDNILLNLKDIANK